ncbi:MAG TPA: PA0069 family radical SAM protein [Myxococcota bacterium]|nr:PA0069 family radical SAM protein [Myxococcota bacterium]
MARYREPIRGRGTPAAPANRFESAALEPDAETGFDDELTPDPRTQFLRDASRSAIARNQSPDVGFDVGINPYRGCEHGCIYCLAPETPVLHADLTWRPLGEVRPGDSLVGFDEHCKPRSTRKLRAATVLGVWWSRKESTRLVTRGAELVTTAEHRWLQARNFRWWRTSQLAPGRSLRRVPVESQCEIDDDYRAGYIAGLSAAETPRPQAAFWRVSLAEAGALARVAEYLKAFGLPVVVGPSRVEVRSLCALGSIDKLVHVDRASASYRRGFLAGSFDAGARPESEAFERARRWAQSLGLRIEARSNAERMRFFAACRPADRRKLEAVFGHEPAWEPEPIEALEPGGVRDVVDIQTSTGTFFAAGLATHNCYARPTHEYLGFSAGLDFETKIVVKHDLPELLRAHLARPSWKPQVIALSGVTDCYQPVEQRLRLTRRCLQVLAEFRNPCSVITKSRLVARDADVLQELARHQAVSVTVSLTSLDPELARKMEPRAAQPRARLAAIEALARSGVPVGVNLAPIVPGLTDHEIPALVAAAAAAGARWAGWQIVRLPYSVKDLFAAWLADHFPDRRDKVLHRIESMRQGKLNDSRFGIRHRGVGVFAEQIAEWVSLARKRHGIPAHGPELSTAAFRRPGGAQLDLL